MIRLAIMCAVLVLPACTHVNYDAHMPHYCDMHPEKHCEDY